VRLTYRTIAARTRSLASVAPSWLRSGHHGGLPRMELAPASGAVLRNDGRGRRPAHANRGFRRADLLHDQLLRLRRCSSTWTRSAGGKSRGKLTAVRQYIVMAERGDAGHDPARRNLLRGSDRLGDPDFAWPVFDERAAACFVSHRVRRRSERRVVQPSGTCCPMSTGAGTVGAYPLTTRSSHSGFFHCNGWAVPFFRAMYGAKLVLPGRRAIRMAAPADRRGRITAGPGVPTIWLSMLDHCRASGLSLGRLNRFTPVAQRLRRDDRGYLREFASERSTVGDDRTTSGSTISFARARCLSMTRWP